MRLRVLSVLCFTFLMAMVTSAFAQDTVSGTWSGDWGPSAYDRNPVTISLKWDGKALTGSVTGGEGVAEPIPIQKATFDPKTGAVHMEVDTKNPRNLATVRFIIDGKVEKGMMTGSWNHDNRKGDFKLTK